MIAGGIIMEKTAGLEGKGLKMLGTLLLMYVLTGILLLILALLLYKFQLNEKFVSAGIIGVYIFAGLTGGLVIGKRMGKRKFLWGLAVGTVYFLILFAGSAAMNHGLPEDLKRMILVWIMCGGAGMIGGMLRS